MQLIVPHINSDLDALGTAVAAHLLYPRARIVLPGTLHPTARDFARLHRYHLNTLTAHEVDLSEVRSLVVVDTADPDRLGPFGALTKRAGRVAAVFDHHPPAKGDVVGRLHVYEPVGAASTLMAELLHEACERLDPFVATAMLLGIYADTHGLMLSSTTSRDAYAAGWLLEQGANLRVVEAFCRQELTPEQQEVLGRLAASAQWVGAEPNQIRLAITETAEYLGGLSQVVHRLQELQRAPVWLVAVAMAKKVYVVARSEVQWLDVAQLLTPLGGGGHPGAASAAVKGLSLARVVDQLQQALAEIRPPHVTVSSIMATPARSLPPETTVEEAERIMLRYGHSGLPVTHLGEVQGVISRGDVEKARRHGLGHVPVQNVMTRPAVTISIDTPLAEVQALMLRRDLGRLPVVDGQGQLVGIVSRSDLLRLLYGGEAPHWHQTLYRTPEPTPVAELAGRLRSLPAPLPDVLLAAGELGWDLGMPAYAVGGFVRDLLLGRPNLDLDLVVEGHGITFAGALASRLGGQVAPVPRFGTAHVQAKGLRIDVATARREYYSHAAALPQVEHADLRADLYRRDFTFNALAIRLDQGLQAELVDLYGGYADLQAGLIRVLHSLSFVEDPTRIVRAVRFLARYGFAWEPETRALALQAVHAGYLAQVTPERLRTERVLILQADTAVAALQELHEIEALPVLVPGARVGGDTQELLSRVDFVLQQPAVARMEARRDLVLLLVLIHNTHPSEVAGVLADLRLTREERRVLEPALLGWRTAFTLLQEAQARPSQLTPALGQVGAEGLCVLWLLAGRDPKLAGFVTSRIESYWNEWRNTHLNITGRDLAELGAGAAVGETLRRVLAAKLDGQVRGRVGELALAHRLLAGRSSD